MGSTASEGVMRLRPAFHHGQTTRQCFLLVFAASCFFVTRLKGEMVEPGSLATAAPAGYPSPAMTEFDAHASARELNLRVGEVVTLSTRSKQPGRQLTEIRDMTGNVVRKLVDEMRPPGSFEDAWDGYGEGGRRIRDGQYRWVATLDTGDRCLTVDRSAELDGDYEVKSHPEYQPWAPFDNVPLRIQHAFERPGQILLIFSPVIFPVYARCDPPQFCRWLEGYHPSGPFVYEWAGSDEAGAYRPEIQGVLVISSHENLSRNAIVVHGGSPELTGLVVSPAYYAAGTGRQQVEFSVRAHPGDRLEIAVTWTNHESRSVVRRLRRGSVLPGRLTLPWDGRSETGMAAAPGGYTVRVVVEDSIGNRASCETLTTLVY